MDFTLKIYRSLLESLQRSQYEFITFEEYIKGKQQNNLPGKFVILRHDVDDLANNSLDFSRIQAEFGVRGTFYFRMIPQSYNETIIKEMLTYGHEVGYHYETMDTSQGKVDEAYQEFLKHLETFRGLCEVKTISMHGSPLSKFDNRDIWRKYSYKDLGIIGEPYFDFEFNEVYYITDTGRAWDGDKYNIRDKAPVENPLTNTDFIARKYHSTSDIIRAIGDGTYPERVMMNFHPERWTDRTGLWMKQYVKQTLKNQVKRLLLALRS